MKKKEATVWLAEFLTAVGLVLLPIILLILAFITDALK